MIVCLVLLFLSHVVGGTFVYTRTSIEVESVALNESTTIPEQFAFDATVVSRFIAACRQTIYGISMALIAIVFQYLSVEAHRPPGF